MAFKSATIGSSQTKVLFNIKKLGFLSIKGTLADFQGDIVFDENDLANASFNVRISSITIDTGNAKRDEHLKSKDFFCVKEFPNIHFQSTSIRKKKQQYVAIGKLTLLGESKEISIPFTAQNGALKGGFSINRLDYKLGTKFPTVIVGKTVQISINTILK